MSCETCRHAEMCRWVNEVGARGCDFEEQAQADGDAVSRQAVLDYIDKMPSELTADGRIMIRRRALEEYISDTLPPVTPKEPTGHWFAWKPEDDVWRTTCSECGEETRTLWDYCPNCGAKMDDEQERSE